MTGKNTGARREGAATQSQSSADSKQEASTSGGKWTPGPWRIREDWDGDKNFLVDCGDPSKPHTVGNIAAVTNYEPFMSATHLQERQRAVAQANARLIAASPTLLAAAETAERILVAFIKANPKSHSIGMVQAVIDLQDAINQALGND